jgi:hypothetical protein
VNQEIVELNEETGEESSRKRRQYESGSLSGMSPLMALLINLNISVLIIVF